MTLAQLLAKGGWMMIPIYLCSFVALVIFAKKTLELKRARLGDVAWIETVLSRLRAGDLQAAGAECDRSPNPAGRVAKATLAVLAVRPDRAEAEAERAGSLELQRLERHFGVLSFISEIAPLLGLLGTVVGMVDLFIGLGAHELEAARLSSGIWQALLTTAAGLIVAVPAMAAHAWLTASTDRFRLQLGDTVARILTEAPR